MNPLDSPINEKGLLEIHYTHQPGLGNVEHVWRHPDGVILYRLYNSTEWHVNTAFVYNSIILSPVTTFRELRDIHTKYLIERQKALANWN